MKRLLTPSVIFATTTLVVFGGIVASRIQSQARVGGDPWDCFLGSDGDYYARIATVGYNYVPGQPSTISWFPGYPILAKAVQLATGLPIAIALTLASNAALAAAFAAFSVYLKMKLAGASAMENDSVRLYSLLAFGLTPATFFFRVGYSESLFVACSILSFCGIERRWPVAVIAAIVGFATGTRAFGVALLVPFGGYLWTQSTSIKAFFLKSALWLPLACWGLMAFIAFQYLTFGEALAFVKTQSDLRLRAQIEFGDKCLALASWEPIWSVYVSSSPAFWGNLSPRLGAWKSLQFANPIYFVCAAVLVALGCWRRWLSHGEVAYTVTALFIAYWTRSYEMCMNSQARFAVALFPLYIVLGQIGLMLPRYAVIVIALAAAWQLYVYAGCFAMRYAFF